MKKVLSILMCLLTVLAIGIPVLATPDPVPSPISVNPGGPSNPDPKVFLVGRWMDIGMDDTGTGDQPPDESVNPFNMRGGSYAFVGEEFFYWVIVRDESGAMTIPDNGARLLVNGAEEAPCTPMGWNSCLSDCQNYPTACDSSAGGGFKGATDRCFRCVGEVEPSWTGSTVTVRGYDTTGGSSQGGIEVTETWDFNPAVTVALTTNNGNPLSFEDADPGETAMSNNKLVVTNDGEVSLWVWLAGSQFSASSGSSYCGGPGQTLDISNFDFRANQGTFMSSWITMRQYDGSSVAPCQVRPHPDTCMGGLPIPTNLPFNVLGRNQQVEVQFRLNWPTPCYGNYDTGTFYAIIKAV